MQSTLATSLATAYTAVKYAAESDAVTPTDTHATARAIAAALHSSHGFGWATGEGTGAAYTGKPNDRLFYTATADGRVTEYRTKGVRRGGGLSSEQQMTLAVPLGERRESFTHKSTGQRPEDVKQLRDYHEAAHGRIEDAGVRQIRQAAAFHFTLPEGLHEFVQSVLDGRANTGMLSDYLRDHGMEKQADSLLRGPGGPEVAANKPLDPYDTTHAVWTGIVTPASTASAD